MSYTPRTIATIQQQIIDQKNSYTSLNGLSSPSQTAIWRLWTFITAVAISLFEQILSIFSADIEAKLINTVSGTAPWIYNNTFLFQYDSTIPQVVVVDPITYQITYPTVDVSKRLVTRCAVGIRANQIVEVKVAKSEPPTALASGELSSLQSYMNTIMPAGIQTICISSAADQIRIEADIYYNGQYSSVIQTNVQTAINLYLAGINFGGTFYVSKLEDAILSVVGVKDISFKRITARTDGTTFDLLTNTQIYVQVGNLTDINNRKYTSYAGYFLTETTAGNTINDTLNYYIS